MILADEKTVFVLGIDFDDRYKYFSKYEIYDNIVSALVDIEYYKKDDDYIGHSLFISEEITENENKINLYRNMKK